MKKTSILLLLSIFISFSLIAQKAGFYQLKIYNLETETQVQKLDNYLKTAYLPALHRAGISKVGVFKPISNPENTKLQIFVLMPLQSLEQFDNLPSVLKADKTFLSDGKDYIQADYENPPYQRIESILLKAFKEMPETGVPNHTTPKSERVYELRNYQGATEKYFQSKVHMFNEGGEVDLFKELGFQPVFFGSVISGPSMPNLMYLTTFANEAAQAEHWSNFVKHRKWMGMKDLEQYKNTVSKIEKTLLRPCDYSDL